MNGHPRLLPALCLFLAVSTTMVRAQYQYPFQDPNLPEEVRVTNMVSLMTLDEKIGLLRFRSDVPRLGIPRLGSVEGIHGEAMGGVANWAPKPPIPTTIFPQGIGMAETWDTGVLRQAGAVEGYEVRYIAQNPKYHHTNQLVVFAPNADLGRDPRWGRTEECYGEDPFFNGTMAVAFIHGLQGNHPRYWQTASLLKHFLPTAMRMDANTRLQISMRRCSGNIIPCRSGWGSRKAAPGASWRPITPGTTFPAPFNR